MVESSNIQLPEELRNTIKSLTNIKNKENEYFRWCHIRHLDPVNKSSLQILKIWKRNVVSPDYEGIEFPTFKKSNHKIKTKHNISISVFGYKK